jgi:DNA-directed RNA polymerase specialized sigma24 family protein
MKEDLGRRLDRLKPQLMEFAALLCGKPDEADELVFLTFVEMQDNEKKYQDVLVLLPEMKRVCGEVFVRQLKVKN